MQPFQPGVAVYNFLFDDFSTSCVEHNQFLEETQLEGPPNTHQPKREENIGVSELSKYINITRTKNRSREGINLRKHSSNNTTTGEMFFLFC